MKWLQLVAIAYLVIAGVIFILAQFVPDSTPSTDPINKAGEAITVIAVVLSLILALGVLIEYGWR